MTRAAVLAGLLAIAACHRRAPLASCDDDLRGVYVAGAEAAGAERWMILDNGAKLEAYPLFSDVDGPPDLEIHPRRIDLSRDSTLSAGSASTPLAGTVHRRYLRRAEICEAQ